MTKLQKLLEEQKINMKYGYDEAEIAAILGVKEVEK